MDQHIEDRGGVDWIPNPTDPRENFADRWVQYPERREAFYGWLQQARQDFADAGQAYDAGRAVDALAPRLGRRLVEAAAGRRVARPGLVGAIPGALVRTGSRAVGALKSIVEAPYRKTPIWPERQGGAVRISRALSERNGYRPKRFSSNSEALKKNASLTFEAITTVRRPFHVYWQITNTGQEALAVQGGGRGEFREGEVRRGKLTHGESTLYAGSHGIECFIVKDGYLVARSGVFVVNIA